MLHIKLICVGKLRDAHFRTAAQEYEKRLTGLCRFELVEIPESRLPENPSQALIDNALDKEGGLLLQKAKGLCVPLCIEGSQVDSAGMAQLLEKAANTPGSISFFIGSSFGLSPKVKESGKGISMSRMTFPHTLARVMLMEQIYRGIQIQNNTRYHK